MTIGSNGAFQFPIPARLLSIPGVRPLELEVVEAGMERQLARRCRQRAQDDARQLLNAAFTADPFNVRVANSLKVLRHLEKYETIQTPHYLLRYDEKTDAALAHYLAEYLEGLYDDLAKQFNYRPTGPILVEVFNNHDMFSGRIVALPDLHTIGACTGRMFAMVSPKGKGIRRPFNWGRVIRHDRLAFVAAHPRLRAALRSPAGNTRRDAGPGRGGEKKWLRLSRPPWTRRWPT